MDLQQTLKALENDNQYYAREAVSEAILRRDEIIPALLKILEDVIERPESFIDSQRFDHMYAMFVLAQFRETRAYPLLVKIFSVPGEFAFDLAGDTVTEDLDQLLASVSGGDISGMAALVENEDANEYVRGASLRGLSPIYKTEPKIGRNDPCPCGSGKKYKKRCGR